MSTTIPALHLSEILALETTPVEAEGPVVRHIKLGTARHLVPPELQDVFALAVKLGEEVSLVTCRRSGVPERSDGTHNQYFLVLSSTNLKTVGITI